MIELIEIDNNERRGSLNEGKSVVKEIYIRADLGLHSRVTLSCKPSQNKKSRKALGPRKSHYDVFIDFYISTYRRLTKKLSINRLLLLQFAITT